MPPPSEDAFSNAISNAGIAGSNAATGAPGHYRLEVAELREAGGGTPGEYELGPFRDPFRTGDAPGSVNAVDEDGAFDDEEEAMEAWTRSLAGAGVSAELAEGPGHIRHQRAPCYRLTDPQGDTTHVVVRTVRTGGTTHR